jgi:ACT domain-containing protein
MSPGSHRIIVTVVGHDRTGIIAETARVLADAGANIIDISQTLLEEFFVMILMADLSGARTSLDELKASLTAKATQLGLRIDAQHEDVFRFMHSYIGGLSGAFIPVSEDIGMIEAAAAGVLAINRGADHSCATQACRRFRRVWRIAGSGTRDARVAFRQSRRSHSSAHSGTQQLSATLRTQRIVRDRHRAASIG